MVFVPSGATPGPSRQSRARTPVRRRSASRGRKLTTAPTAQMAGTAPSECTLSKVEYFAAIDLAPNTTESGGVVALSMSSAAADSMPFARKMGKMFERVRWVALSVEYIAHASAMTSGSLAMGMDWDAHLTSVSWVQVTTLSPMVVTQVAKSATLRLPSSRLMPQKWLNCQDAATKAPGNICWVVKGDSSKDKKTMGSLYIRYELVFSGTSA